MAHNRSTGDGAVSMNAPTVEEIRELADTIKNYLSDVSFEKHPHVATLFPPSLVSEEPGEEKEEEEELYVDRSKKPSIAGLQLLAKPASKKRELIITYRFVVRRAPPNTVEPELSYIVARAVIENEKYGELELAIWEFNNYKEYKEYIKSKEKRKPSLIKRIKLKRKERTQGTSFSIKLPAEAGDDIGHYFRSPDFIFGKVKGEGKPRELKYTTRCTLLIEFEEDLEGLRITPLIKVNEPKYELQGQLAGNPLVLYVLDGSKRPWAFGHLMQVEIDVKGKGYILQSTFQKPSEEAFPGWRDLNPLALTVAEWSINLNDQTFKLSLRDWATDEERNPVLEDSSRELEDDVTDFLNLVGLNNKRIINAFTKAIRYAIKGDKLRLFQVQTVKELLTRIISVIRALLKEGQMLTEENGACLALIAPTASGKTLPKDIATLILTVILKLRRIKGVKALMFYPTKALAGEQAENLVKMAIILNKELYPHIIKEPISIGVYHGSTPSVRKICKEGLSISRITCPICGRGILALSVEYGEEKEPRITLKCYIPDPETHEPIENSTCNVNLNPEVKRLVWQTIKLIREHIVTEPPDILITTPDMLNYHLMLDPWSHTIIGRKLKVCPKGPHTVLSDVNKCPKHKKPPLKSTGELASPILIVFDEAHLLRGVFGSQVHYLIARLETAIQAIKASNTYKPVILLMSATIGNPETFAENLLGRKLSSRDIIKVHPASGSKDKWKPLSAQGYRHHLFLLPKAWRPMDTLVQSLKSIIKWFIERKGRLPKVLIFVNRISEANEIVTKLRAELQSHVEELSRKYGKSFMVKIDGHSTDYGDERAKVEDDFSKGRIDILVATRGLEVGVNFHLIDVLVLYGAAYYVSDYWQRVGRGGRSRPALVLHILTDKPLDFFYFKNWKVLTDPELRDAALRAENVPIKRDNDFVINMVIRRAILDYLATLPDSYLYFERSIRANNAQGLIHLLRRILKVTSSEEIRKVLESINTEGKFISVKELNDKLIEYIARVLRKPPKEVLNNEKYKSVIESFINNVLIPRIQSSEVKTLAKFLDKNSMFDLIDMRLSEHAIIMKALVGEVPSRGRELSMVIFNAASKSIVMFRGLAYEALVEG